MQGNCTEFVTFLFVAVLVTFDVEPELIRSLLVREAVFTFLTAHSYHTDHEQDNLKHKSGRVDWYVNAVIV
jgi:hypothetical protein